MDSGTDAGRLAERLAPLSSAEPDANAFRLMPRASQVSRRQRVEIHPELPSQRPAAGQHRSSGSVPSTHGGKTEVMKPTGKDSRSQLIQSWDRLQIPKHLLHNLHSRWQCRTAQTARFS